MCYLSYFFTNISKVYPGPSTHALSLSIQHIDWAVCIFDLALSRAALLGVDWQIGSSSRNFLLWPEWLELLPLMCFWFYKVRPDTFNIISPRLLSHGLLKEYRGLLSFLEGSIQLFYLWRFCRGIRNFLRSWVAFSMRLGKEDSVPIFLLVSATFDRFLFQSVLNYLAASLVDRFFPWITFWKVIRSFRRDCFATASDVLGCILPTLWCNRPLKKKV